ncbi:hypothetical protein [Microvirga arsenatis]|uniref:Uncharacterized protein n=1 Tax=Microvirga arsenatis TaxID=2692265 RepID=A0ABW9Z426_9HYPH|nr:hypothetical protein [Microvirga arsenatis]NBJ13745.1 hypothetical protein [Microvirga arsenatis]NBJ27215.1 hypothetical protein [Microvirga arsenatis]
MSDTHKYDDMPRATFITDKMARFRQRLAATYLVHESAGSEPVYYTVTLEESEGISEGGVYTSLAVTLYSAPVNADPPFDGEPEDGRWFRIDEAGAAWDAYHSTVSYMIGRGMKPVERPHNDYTLGYLRALLDLMEYHGGFEATSNNNPAVRDAHHWTRMHIRDLIKGIRGSAGADYLQDPNSNPRR